MDKSTEFRRLFNAGFNESLRWTDWFFNNVYDDSKVMTGQSSGQTVCCLMLDSYRLKLGSSTCGMSYISCATTLRAARGKGHMRRLLADALMESASRGDAIASLIPASERLYFYYDKLDFSTIFYADEQRYTSLHNFRMLPEFVETEPSYECFHALESSVCSRVLHSERDFANILADNSLDGGETIAIKDSAGGETKAMLFAVCDKETVRVKDMLTADKAAEESILAVLRRRVGERMIIIDAAPSDSSPKLSSRGMGRIVNVGQLLQAIVTDAPDTEQVIRVRDRLIPENNAIFIVHRGQVERTGSTLRRVTLDVGIDTLAKVIFNSDRIGSVFGLPAYRPAMTLML